MNKTRGDAFSDAPPVPDSCNRFRFPTGFHTRTGGRIGTPLFSAAFPDGHNTSCRHTLSDARAIYEGTVVRWPFPWDPPCEFRYGGVLSQNPSISRASYIPCLAYTAPRISRVSYILRLISYSSYILHFPIPHIAYLAVPALHFADRYASVGVLRVCAPAESASVHSNTDSYSLSYYGY